MLIWGFKTLFKTLSEGVFHCPRCGGDRQYHLKLARRWFTFFFIPIFPFKQQGTHVECTTCKGTYHDTVLQQATSAQISAHLSQGMHALALAVLRVSGTAPSTAARTAAVGAVVESGVPAYTVERLDADLAGPGHDLASVLVPLGDQLQAQGREWLLTRATLIAAADGGIGSAERALLDQVGGLLQMTPAHVAGVVETTQRSVPRG
ncbi:zinc-ribbon domain-containing protein [Embleya sp. NBC_00896]|uniref:zinc-ribbon domain-containing protein n=1 Tax=Embleya sp. NBC_00896 TaxID=2975961 RepID=UPI002F90E15E|nr:zinc-ribbon domain-containing protein [Embleya sp. NBC_00896]